MHVNANIIAAPDRVYCVDLAKNTFQLHVFGPRGERLQRRTLTRSAFERFFADPQRPRGLVVMEACASAHHWARYVQARGHRAKLLPPQFVALHRIGNKTDGNDADAIYAAHCDPRVRAVPVKSIEQQDRCARHRTREQLQRERTACVNHMRGELAERGWIVAKGAAGEHAMRTRVHEPAEGEVTQALLELLALDLERLERIEQQLAQIDRYLEAEANTCPVARRLDTLFGVGAIISTAFAAETGGSVERYADARQFAASVGITAREDSSGQTRRLGPITKRGNPYLRKLLVQGAQSVVNHCQRRDDALCLLARRLLAAHKPRNVVVVAVANRMARIIYALIKHDTVYQPAGRPTLAAAA
jgi:transposase